MSDPPKRDLLNRNAPLGDSIPIRTYSQTHPEVGFLEFSIPIQTPEEIEGYLIRKCQDLSPTERYFLVNKLLKIADEMWSGYVLWVGDPVEARSKLLENSEVREACRQY